MPDYSALARLHEQCFVTPRAWSASEIESLCQTAGCFLIEEPAGFLLGRSIAGEAELLTLAVDPEARRQGIGRRLVEAFLKKSCETKAETVFLEVSSENPAAIALYGATGFRQAGKRRAYYHSPDGRAVDALVLQQDLGANP